jgi:hypothetical protein
MSTYNESNDPNIIIVPIDPILQELKIRLESNRPGGNATAVAFNATTLAASMSGQQDVIWRLLQDNFKDQNSQAIDTFIIENATLDLNVNVNTLRVTGTTAINDKTTQVNALFTLDSKDYSLQLTMTLTLSTDWVFSDSFAGLKWTLFDDLYVSQNKLFLTSYAHTETGVFYDLQEGLNFLGTLSLTSTLVPITSETAATAIQTVNFGGHIDYTQTVPEFTMAGESAFSDITVTLLELSDLTLGSGALSLQSTINSDTDQENTYLAQITGNIQMAGQARGFILDVPTKHSGTLGLTQQTGTATVGTIAVAATLFGGSTFSSSLPTSLSNLTAPALSKMSYLFDPLYSAMTQASFSLSSSQTFNLLPGKISLSNLSLSLDVAYITYFPGELQKVFTAIINGTFNLGALSVNAQITIPTQGDWVIEISPNVNDTLTLSAIANFINTDAANIINAIPGISGISQSIALAGVKLTVDPQTPELKSAAFSIAQTQDWNVVSGLLSIYDWQLDLMVSKEDSSWTTTGSLSGKFKLGGETGIQLDLYMPIPMQDGAWVLSVSEPFNLTNLLNLLKLTGSENVTGIVPQGIRDLLDYDITRLEIAFNPTKTPIIQSVFFQMNSNKSWNIIADKGLVLDELDIAFMLHNSSQSSDKYVTGFIGGQITVAGHSLHFVAQKGSKTAPWLFRLNTVASIHLPSPAELAGWLLGAEMKVYIPSALQPFPDGFDLTDMNFTYNISDTKIEEIGFTIVNSNQWQVIPSYVALDHTYITTKITNPSGLQLDSCRIATSLLLGNTEIKFAALKESSGSNWEFSGELADRTTIDFNQLLQKVNVDSQLSPPVDLNLPVVTINSANASFTPADGLFHFDGDGEINWTLPFLGMQFPLTRLGGSVDIRNKQDDTANNYKKGTIYGTLEFGSLIAQLALRLGTGQDTIFTATIENTRAGEIRLTQLTDALAPDQSDVKWNALTHGQLAAADGNDKITFDNAYIYLNKTQKTLFLYGSILNLGSAVLLVQKPDDTGETTPDSGYLFAFSLADNFKFMNLFAPLTFIDSIFQIKKGFISVNTFQIASAAALKTKLDAIVNVDEADKPGTLTTPIEIGTLPAGALQKGMRLYGELDFTIFDTDSYTNSVFKRILDIQSVPDKSSLILYAAVTEDDNNDKKWIFQADFNASLTLLNTITFSDVNLEYSCVPDPQNADQPKSKELNLSGNIRVSLFSTNYDFAGKLKLLPDRTSFNVTTQNTQDILAPFGLPNTLVINNLGLDVIYTFATTANPTTSLMLDVSGEVALLDTVKFAAHLVVENSPKLLTIALTDELSIDRFFNKLIPGQIWPSDFLDITFKSGEIYYAPADFNYSDKLYKTGLHAGVEIDIYGFTFNMLVDKTDTEFKISAQKTAPIDWTVLQLTDTTEDTKGPSLYVTLSGDKKLGFNTGLSLFNEKFANVDLKYNITDSQFEGTVEYTGSIEMFKDASISFVWSDLNGFQITSWPMAYIDTALEYADLISEASKEIPSECGEIVSWAFDKAVETHFTLDTKFGMLNSDGKLPLTLTIGYQIKLAGINDSIIDTKLPDLVVAITLPTELTFAAFATAITDTITNNAGEIARQLLSDPGKLTAFVAAVGLESVAEEAIGSLVCRGLKRITEPPEAPEGEPAEESADELLESAEELAEVAETAEELAAATGAAAGAGAAAEGAADGFAVAIGFFAALLAGIGIGAAAQSAINHKKDIEEKKRRAEAAKEKAKQAVIKLLEIKHLTLTHDGTQNEITASWDTIPGASNVNLEYEISVYRNEEANDIEYDMISNTSIKFSCPETGRNDFHVKMKAKCSYTYNGKVVDCEGNEATEAKTIENLIAPTNLNLEQVTTSITASWQKGDEITTSYKLELIDPANPTNNVVASWESITDLHYTIDGTSLPAGTSLTAGTTYTLKVTGVDSTFYSQPLTGTIKYVTLAVPSDINHYYTQTSGVTSLHVNWEAVAGVADYAIQLFSATGTLLNPTITITGTSAEIQGAMIQEGELYQLRIGSKTSDLPTPQTVWSEKKTFLPAPTGLNFNLDDNLLFVITWNEVTHCSGYTVEIIDESDSPVVSKDGDSTENTMVIPLHELNGTTGVFRARIVAKGSGQYINSYPRISSNSIFESSRPPIGLWALKDNGVVSLWIPKLSRWVDIDSEESRFIFADPLVAGAYYFIKQDGTIGWYNVDTQEDKSFSGITATQISDGGNERLWAIESAGNWTRWAPEYTRWDWYSEHRKFIFADPSTQEACYYVDPDGSVHWRDVDTDTNKSYPGITANQVSVGGNGQIWALKEDGSVARWLTATSNWVNVNIGIQCKYIFADPTTGSAYYYVDSQGSVYWHNADTPQTKGFPFITAKQISIGASS